MVRRLHVPLLKPEDVIPHLAKPGHWRSGYSAQELAVAWWNAGNDFPQTVRRVLNTASEYVHAEFVAGFFEHQVDLGSPGRNSQTDLMVIAGLYDQLATIAVEGKAEESFGNGIGDFAAFSCAIGIPLSQPDLCSSAKEFDGVSLRLAWVSDKARAPLAT